MDTLQAIRTRRSIRVYQDKSVPQDLIDQVLAAAMYAPSAGDARPWQFVVIDDRKLLRQIPAVHPHAPMAEQAPLAILVCGDLGREKYSGNWPLDCAAAVENLLLATHAVGLGSVWTGVYPNQGTMQGLGRLLGLPKGIMAHTLVVLGYPAEQPTADSRHDRSRVHLNGW
jgi:nitroreductase